MIPTTPTMSGVKMGLRFYCHRTLRYTSANLILQQNVDKISIIGIGKIVKDGIYPVLPVFEQERELGVRCEPEFLRMIQFAFNLRNTGSNVMLIGGELAFFGANNLRPYGCKLLATIDIRKVMVSDFYRAIIIGEAFEKNSASNAKD